jgi:hypothetical protein
MDRLIGQWLVEPNGIRDVIERNVGGRPSRRRTKNLTTAVGAQSAQPGPQLATRGLKAALHAVNGQPNFLHCILLLKWTFEEAFHPIPDIERKRVVRLEKRGSPSPGKSGF